MFNLFSRKKTEDILQKYNRLSKKTPFLNEKWRNHFFAIQYEKPKKIYEDAFLDELENLQKKILGFLIQNIAEMDSINKSCSIKSFPFNALPKEYQKAFDFEEISEYTYVMLIRFPEKRKDDETKDAHYRQIAQTEKREYLFSIVQSLQSAHILHAIESTLHIITKINPQELMTRLVIEDDDIIVYNFDGLQYISYSFSQRAKLFSKYPDLDDKVFGTTFEEFVNDVFEKETRSALMGKVCSKVREIIKKHAPKEK